MFEIKLNRWEEFQKLRILLESQTNSKWSKKGKIWESIQEVKIHRKQSRGNYQKIDIYKRNVLCAMLGNQNNIRLFMVKKENNGILSLNFDRK